MRAATRLPDFNLAGSEESPLRNGTPASIIDVRPGTFGYGRGDPEVAQAAHVHYGQRTPEEPEDTSPETCLLSSP